MACSLPAKAQELNAQVSVNADQIQATNKQVFKTLETSIREFLNDRKWTNEKYLPEERITCQFLLTIDNRSSNEFQGNLQISYSRPVYMSDYSSPVFVHRDDKVRFEYLEFDRLDFSINTNLSNLTSLLAYYAYIIIGLDHDTFEPKGGDPFFDQAQKIVGNAQGSGYEGWATFDGNKNRFILLDNFTSSAFDNLRLALYQYHREALDKMYEPKNHRAAKETIKKALMSLKEVNDKRRNSLLMQIFFDAKSKEIMQVFGGGEPIDLADLKDVLRELDPSNSSRYDQLGKA